MKTPLLSALVAATLLGGCSTISESRLNPFNWFGKSKSEPTVEVPAYTDPRRLQPLVTEVTEMRVERAPGGAIVHAVGLPPIQGFWAAGLIEAELDDPQDGVLVLDFIVEPPYQRYPAGTERSRELTAALFLSDQSLAGIRTVVVRGKTNQRSARR